MSTAKNNILGRLSPAPGEIDLLRAAIVPGSDGAAAWNRWRVDHDLDGAHGRAHAVFPAVAANLGSELLGADAGRMMGLRRRTWATNQLMFQAAGRVLDTLEPLQAEPIVAKGVALALVAYPHIGDRNMGDMDITIGPEHFDAALDLLCADGWTLGTDSRNTSYAHAVSLFDSERNELDLHRWVAFPRFCRSPERWSQRAVPFVVAGRECRRYADADELVLTLVHGAGPEFSSAIRWPIDAWHRIERSAGEQLPVADRAKFWSDVVASASELRVAQPVEETLRFCAEQLSIAVPNDAFEQLAAADTDAVMAAEWRLLKRGLPTPQRMRPFVDTERAGGRRPSALRYARGRVEAARAGGSTADMLRRRTGKAGRLVTARRSWGRTW